MRRLPAFLLGSAILVGLLGAPASGAELTNCMGTAQSVGGNGNPVDTVSAPGPGGTQSDPFVVDYEGSVVASGSGPVMKNHSWVVNVWFVPVRTGGDPNEGGDTTLDQERESIKDYIKFRVTGLYYVSGSISGEGGSCTGSGWVKVEGSPVGTLPWLAGVVITVGGAVVAFFARPRAVSPMPGPGGR